MSMERNRLEAELAQLHARSFGWALRCCHEDGEAAAEVLQTTYVKILSGNCRKAAERC